MSNHPRKQKSKLVNFQIEHGEKVVSYTPPLSLVNEILPHTQRIVIAQQVVTSKKKISMLQSIVVEHFGALKRSKRANTISDAPPKQEVSMQSIETDLDDDLIDMLSAAQEAIDTAMDIRNNGVDLNEIELSNLLADYDRRQEMRWCDQIRKL